MEWVGYDLPMRAWIRVYGTLAAAVVIGGVLTVPFLYESVWLLLGRGDGSTLRGAYALMGADSAADITVFRTLGILEGVPALLAAVILVGVALRREWAREAGAAIFFLFGVVATFVSLGGMADASRAPRAVQGFIIGLASFVVVALLMVKPTADAVMWHQHHIDTRKHVGADRRAS